MRITNMSKQPLDISVGCKTDEEPMYTKTLNDGQSEDFNEKSFDVIVIFDNDLK